MFEYDAAHRMTLASDDVGTVTTLTYDAAGNVVKRKDANNHEWEMDFDAAGRLVELKDPIVETGTDKFATFQYDAVGNLTLVTDPSGIQTKNEYDKLSRLVKSIEDSGGAEQTDTELAYNALGLITSIKDNEHNTTTYSYDNAARVKTVTYPDSTGGSDLVTLGYDLANKKITRTDQKGIVATTTFNDLGQSVSREYKQGTTTLLSETFTFDKSGRMLTGDNGFAKVTNTFDNLGRLDLTKQKYLTENKEFTTDLAYTVGTSGSTRTLTYHASRTVTETLDKRGRLTDVTGGTGIGGGWSFDAANRLTSASLDNNVTSTFSYDLKDRLTGITHARDVSSVITKLYEVEYGYDVTDNRLFTENKLHTDRSELYEYDGRHRLHKFQRGTLFNNNTEITMLAHATLPARYGWKPSGWMDSRGNWSTFAKEIGVSPVIKWQSRTHNGANEIQVIDPDVQNGLTTDQVTVSVDANGNLTTDPLAPNVGTAPAGQKYVYDAANRVTAIWRTNVASNPSDDELLLEIEYDALSRRIQTKEWIDPTDGTALTTPNTTWHVYAGLNVVEEYDVTEPGSTSATTDLHRQFIWGQGFPAPVAMIDSTDAGDVTAATGEEVLHYIRDFLGSVVALTDSNGEVVERYEYDPYGNTYISDVDTNGSHDDATYRTYSRFGNPWMWTGQRHDAATGTYHFTGRTLSTNLGRWLQRDPLGYVDGVNLNEYCGGSPVRFVDPMGFGLWEYIVGADGPEATRAFFGSLWGDAKDTAADVYGGVEAIVTGVPGASDAVSDGIDAIVDANAQRILGKWENANNSGEIGYGEAAWELGKDIVGADPLAEGLSGVDLATGSRISTLDSQQRTLNGISGLTGTAAALSGGITSTLEGSGTGCASNAKPPRAPIETPKTPAPKAPVPKAPPPNGPRLYRVFGGEAKGLGQYYTTTNPGSVPNYRVAAGLYPGNTGQFILEGFLSNSEGVMFRTAASGPGGIGGGLPEVFVPNPHAQINIVRVSGVNPPF